MLSASVGNLSLSLSDLRSMVRFMILNLYCSSPAPRIGSVQSAVRHGSAILSASFFPPNYYYYFIRILRVLCFDLFCRLQIFACKSGYVSLFQNLAMFYFYFAMVRCVPCPQSLCTDFIVDASSIQFNVHFILGSCSLFIGVVWDKL